MIYVGVSTLENPKSTSKTDVNFCLSFQVNYYNNGNVHIRVRCLWGEVWLRNFAYDKD